MPTASELIQPPTMIPPPTASVGVPRPIGPTGDLVGALPTFSWSAVPGAVHYSLWVADMTANIAGVYSQYTTGTTGQMGPGMEIDGHQYRWWVSAIDAAGQSSAWSAAADFIYHDHGAVPVNPPAATLGTPNPTGPAGNVVGLPTFSWSTVAGADHYDLWINDLTANLSPNYRNANVNGTSFEPGPGFSSAGHHYRWWVRAVDAAGLAGPWSNGSDYVYYPLPAPTDPVDLSAGTLDSTPALSWSSVGGASNYDVWVDDVTAGQAQVQRDTNVSSTTLTLATSLIRDDTYRFWVRAVGSSGPSPWSAPLDFRVASLKPALQGPTGTVIGAIPTFSWSAVAGADHYDLWVNNVTTGQSQAIRLNNISGPSVAPSTLTGAQNYRWWVRAIDASGVPGPWSASADFAYYAVPAPVLVGPVGATLASKPTLSWNAAAGATGYDLWVDDVTVGVAHVVRNKHVPGTSFTPPTPLAMGHAYRFWVRSLDASANPGPWSTPLDFVVSSSLRPILAGPSGTIDVTTPTYSWSVVAGADHYDLWIDDITTGQAEVVRIKDVVATSIAPAIPLTGGNAYKFWVRAVSAEGQASAWSDPFAFTCVPRVALPGS